ncbi:MAG: hypothetical protein P8N50_00500 [Actinomycetota bacterium]|nr:hypothetical protein [Actinomycetota bacterium]
MTVAIRSQKPMHEVHALSTDGAVDADGCLEPVLAMNARSEGQA